MINIITMATVPNIARPRTLRQLGIILVTFVDKKYAGTDGKAVIARQVNPLNNMLHIFSRKLSVSQLWCLTHLLLLSGRHEGCC